MEKLIDEIKGKVIEALNLAVMADYVARNRSK